jgi:hypothetical protein
MKYTNNNKARKIQNEDEKIQKGSSPWFPSNALEPTSIPGRITGSMFETSKIHRWKLHKCHRDCNHYASKQLYYPYETDFSVTKVASIIM